MPKKIIVSKIGGPEVLNYTDYELSDKISPGYVRIKQTSIGLNYIDTYHRSGIYPSNLDLPFCPGIEASGEIIGLGDNINEFHEGDRICYASPPLGAYCELRDFPANKIVKIPSEISNDIAASIFLQGLTVEYLFERLYKIKKDEIFLFHAAAGGVGLIACQWAKALGAQMIGTVGNEEKGNLAKENGCKYIINYKEENVVEKVKEITNNKGVSVVYDGVGIDTFNTSIECLSFRGLLVSFGQSSGMIQKVDLHKTFNPKSLYFTRPTLMHYNLSRDDLLKSSNRLFSMMKDNNIKDNLTKIYNLKDAKIAHSDLESRKTSGSVIFKI